MSVGDGGPENGLGAEEEKCEPPQDRQTNRKTHTHRHTHTHPSQIPLPGAFPMLSTRRYCFHVSPKASEQDGPL